MQERNNHNASATSAMEHTWFGDLIAKRETHERTSRIVKKFHEKEKKKLDIPHSENTGSNDWENPMNR